MVGTVEEHFGDLEDPRMDRTKKHELLDIIVIALCGVICGADSWVAIEEFGNARQAWLEKKLSLPNGIPSHDTFGRLFARLDPAQFQSCFIRWMQAVTQRTKGEVVALDGKTLRRSYDRGDNQGPIHMISAWSSSNHVVLGQTKVEDKSNEITAIPALLELLDIAGCIITIDAMGCQREIAQKILDREADYVLALKGNQGSLYRDVEETFQMAQEGTLGSIAYDSDRQVDGDHGRIEIRRCRVISDQKYLDYLSEWADWPGLASVVRIDTERRLREGDGWQIQHETRFFLSSLDEDAQRLNEVIRSHWGIENELHWVLDVAFREDDCRVRKGNAAENLARIRHIALTLLRNERTAKCGVKNRRLKAAWSTRYLEKVLLGLRDLT